MDLKNYEWDEILKKSYISLLKSHVRSNEKLKYPHQWIKNRLEYYLGPGYELFSYDLDKSKHKELKIKGYLYDKNVDVAIKKNEEVVGAVSFKFVVSNYSQNSNNYFENLLGECFNIQCNNIPFCHVFVARTEIPYFTRENEQKKIEHLTEHNLEKYLKLAKIKSDNAVPMKLSLSIVDIQGDKDFGGNIISSGKFKNLSPAEKKELLANLRVKISDYEKYDEKIRNQIKKLEINKTLEEFSAIIKNH